jgi:hypothetical protein
MRDIVVVDELADGVIGPATNHTGGSIIGLEFLLVFRLIGRIRRI